MLIVSVPTITVGMRRPVEVLGGLTAPEVCRRRIANYMSQPQIAAIALHLGFITVYGMRLDHVFSRERQ